MKRLVSLSLLIALVVVVFTPSELDAQRRRRVVVRRGPVVRTTVVVRPGHPIARAINRSVVVHPMRTRVVVTAPLVFLPLVVWNPVVVRLPAKDRLVWQDTETIDEEEDWVDSNFGVDGKGDALYLEIDGRAKLDFAEVTFENGNLQVVDFNEKTHGKGLYQLLNFADGRHVKTVRLVAKSESEETKFTVFLKK